MRFAPSSCGGSIESLGIDPDQATPSKFAIRYSMKPWSFMIAVKPGMLFCTNFLKKLLPTA